MLNCVKYNNNNYQLDLFDDKIKFLKDYLKNDFNKYENLINSYIINVDSVTHLTSKEIYSKLGNKTQSENVVIDEVNGRKPAVENNVDIPIPESSIKYAINKIKFDVETEDWITTIHTGNGWDTIKNSISKKALLEDIKDYAKKVNEYFLDTPNRLANKIRNSKVEVKGKDKTGYGDYETVGYFIVLPNQFSYEHIEGKTKEELVNNVEEFIKNNIKSNQSFKPIVAYRTRGNNFLEALEKDNAIGNPWSHLGGSQEIKGINIRSDKTTPNSLGNRLTNPNWYAKELYDVETEYKANASKIKAPKLNAEEALKYDMNLMYQLQLKKFRKNPELIDEINAQGGLEFIKQSSHIVGVKNSRWEGKGLESNFIKVLAKSYETVSKELGKFVESNNKNQYDLYKTNTVKEAVEEFISWMIGEKHTDKLQDYRQAIIDKIPELKNTKILTDNDNLEFANTLDYLINKHDWSNQSNNTETNNNLFTIKIDQFKYTYNPITGKVIHNAKTGDKIETNKTQIGKVLAEYAKVNNLETKEFNKQLYTKVGDKVVNINNGSIVTQSQIVNLFNNKLNKTEFSSNAIKNSTFTFKDGFEVDTPFTLNNEQIEALFALEEFINNPKEFNNQITLLGYAGTGKTTIISIFDKYLKKKYISPYYSSPTHRANAVTKLKNPKAKVLTLHSLFGLSGQFKLEDGDYDLKDLEFAQKNKIKIEKGDTLIVDESSLTNDALYEFLEQNKKSLNLNIIYVGDPGQLKPVGQKDKSKVFLNGKQIQLTTVERTGDNAILEESTNLRNGKDFNYQTKIVDDIGVEYLESSKNTRQIIAENYNSEKFKNNKLYFRILSATNSKVDQANKIVRELLFDTDEQLIQGDILMGYDNFDVDYKTKEPKIINSGDYQVESINKGKKEVNINGKILEYNGYNVTLKNLLNSEDTPKYIFIVDNNEDNTKILKFVDEIAALNIKGQRAMNNMDSMAAAKYFSAARNLESQLAFMKSIIDANGKLKVKKTLDYGYAHTIHKSQGGTYNKVLILADTISNPFDLETQQQLKYVAMSRASEYVYVQTNQKLKEPIIINNTETNNQFTQEDADILKSPEFKEYFNALPEDMQNMLETNPDTLIKHFKENKC